MKNALLGFLRAARAAGITVSPAESIDAFHALERTGFDDRDAVRSALALVLGKSLDDTQRVELVFDRYFSADGAAFDLDFAASDEAIANVGADIALFEAELADSKLAHTLLADDRASGTRSLPRRACRRQTLGLTQLDAAIARLRARRRSRERDRGFSSATAQHRGPNGSRSRRAPLSGIVQR